MKKMISITRSLKLSLLLKWLLRMQREAEYPRRQVEKQKAKTINAQDAEL
jgi:hypothetical protein